MGKRTEWINDFGSILESKAGNLYIKIKKGVELKEGDNILLKNHEESLMEGVSAGRLSQERADEILAKTEFVKYNLSIGPEQ
jgi:hypothetical protein